MTTNELSIALFSAALSSSTTEASAGVETALDATLATGEETGEPSLARFLHSLLLLDDPLVNASYFAYADACVSPSLSSSAAGALSTVLACCLPFHPWFIQYKSRLIE